MTTVYINSKGLVRNIAGQDDVLLPERELRLSLMAIALKYAKLAGPVIKAWGFITESRPQRRVKQDYW